MVWDIRDRRVEEDGVGYSRPVAGNSNAGPSGLHKA